MMSDATAAISVRPILAGDAAAFRALRIEALARCPLAFNSDAAEAEARPAEAWASQVAASTGEGAQVIFLAETPDGRLAGMAGVYTSPQVKVAHTGNVFGVYVRDEFRGVGLGRALTQACIGWARDKGLVVLKLAVVNGNDAARRLYEQCGFTPYGVEPAALRYAGKLYDETLMALRLDGPPADPR